MFKNNQIILIIIIFIIVLLTNLLTKANNSSKKWYMCESSYNPNHLFVEILEQSGYQRTYYNDWNIYLPCMAKYPNKYLDKIKWARNKKPSYLFDCFDIGSKSKIWINLVTFYGRSAAETIMPATYIFPTDHDLFKKSYQKGDSYILKNDKQQQMGITITSDLAEILDHRENGYKLIQKYIKNSITLDHHKINFRVYLVLISDQNQLNAYVYSDGIISYAKDLSKGLIHTFDNSIASFYDSKTLYDTACPIIWSELKQIVKLNWSKIMSKISRKLGLVVHMIKNKLNKYDGFQLFGVDVLIDTQLEPWIIEINVGPGMESHNSIDKQMRLDLHSDMLKLIESGTNNNFMKITIDKKN